LFEIVFLGTSASAPSVQRGLPAQIIKHNEHRFLVDCGEGTQRQILKSGVGFKNLDKILLTHGHLDHILGLGGLISTLSRWEAIESIDLYGAQSALERIKDLIYQIVLRGAKTPMKINFNDIEQGLIFETNDFTITAFPVFHRGTQSFGFVFEEKGRRPFLPEKAEELNIPPGPWRRDLTEGKETRLPDGRMISPDSVMGEFKPGSKLVLIGDSGETKSLEKYCQDADAIVIESTYLEEEAAMAKHFSHLTARMAAELAHKCEAKQLILTHISRRYREKDIYQEAHAVFENVFIARDFDMFTIRQDKEAMPAENIKRGRKK
jgi:ribonuclease Z